MPNQTGPTTTEGKARSSRNAVSHGFTARKLHIPEADQPEYNNFVAGLIDSLKPAGAHEFELAHIMIDGYWRLRRMRSHEEAILEAGPEAFEKNAKVLANLTLYEQRIQRGVEKASKELSTLQAQRIANEKEARAEVLKIHRYNKMAGSKDPAGARWPQIPLQWNDFVFSSVEMDTEQAGEYCRKLVREAARVNFNVEKYDSLFEKAA